MSAAIRRSGCKVVAEIPAGAKVFPVLFRGERCWVVASSNEKPYILRFDGSKTAIEPVSEEGVDP